MKKYFVIAVVMISAVFASAQSNKEEVDLMQAAFGMEKKAMVTEFVKVDSAQADAFWAIYDAYEAERKELGKKRIALLEEYANQYEEMTGEQADAWTSQVLALQKKTDALIAKYYAKVKKASDGMVATQFYLIENYVLLEIRAQILFEIPLPEKK